MQSSRLDDYKTLLGNGARSNKFNITFNFNEKSKGLISALNSTELYDNKLQILTHQMELPQPRDVSTERVHYNGDYFTVPLDRKDFNYEFSIKYYETENRVLFNFFNMWLQFIQNAYGVVDTYSKVNIQAELLNMNRKTVQTYLFNTCFPTKVISGTEASYKNKDLIETNVTFACDYFKVQ